MTASFPHRSRTVLNRSRIMANRTRTLRNRSCTVLNRSGYCPLSNSDFGMSRSSIFRMSKMGGGVGTRHPGQTNFGSGRTFGRVTTPGSVSLLTSHNFRTQFTRRQGGFAVGCSKPSPVYTAFFSSSTG